MAYKLESLCDRLWPTRPDTGHPLAGQYQSCSYGPGQVAFGVAVPLAHPYTLGSIQTQIRISDSSTPARIISCINVTVSPYRDRAWYWDLFLWLPAALAIAFFLLTTTARIATSITLRNLSFKHKARPGGEPRFWKDKLAPTVTDVLAGEPVIQSPALLRFVTPGFMDLWLYIQFVSVLSMIAVRWPDFAYSFFRRTAWTSLLGNVTLVQTSPQDRLQALSSNAFLPANASGSPDFAPQMTGNTSSPLFLDTQSPNTFLNLNGSRNGIESYAHMLGLRPVDVYGTTTAIWLIIVGAVTSFSLLFLLIDSSYTRRLNRQERAEGYTFELTEQPEESHNEKKGPNQVWAAVQKTFGSHLSAYVGNLLRLLLLFHLPLTITSVYHFSTFSSSHPGTVACAVLSFAFFCVLAPAVALWRLCRHSPEALWSEKQLLLTYGPLYNHYDHSSRLFPIITFVHSLALGIVVGAGQRSGSAQAIIILVLEILLAVAYILWLPWGDGATMAPLSFTWSVARIATAVLVLLLSSLVGFSVQARGWLTYVTLLIQAIVAVGFLLLLVVKLIEAGVRALWRVSFDDSTSPRSTGLSGAIHRIHRRKYKTHQLRPPNPKKTQPRTQKTGGGAGSRTPSMTLIANAGRGVAPKGQDFASSPYATYFTPDLTDEGGIMSALPPLRGGEIDATTSPATEAAGMNSTGGFIRLGGGRATDEGTMPYESTTFGPRGAEVGSEEHSPHSHASPKPKSRRFGPGFRWRRVPHGSSGNESLSSSSDEDDDAAYGLGLTQDGSVSQPFSPTTSRGGGRTWVPKWKAFKRVRAGGTPSLDNNTTSDEPGETNELAALPSSGTKAFAVVRPARGIHSAFASGDTSLDPTSVTFPSPSTENNPNPTDPTDPINATNPIHLTSDQKDHRTLNMEDSTFPTGTIPSAHALTVPRGLALPKGAPMEHGPSSQSVGGASTALTLDSDASGLSASGSGSGPGHGYGYGPGHGHGHGYGYGYAYGAGGAAAPDGLMPPSGTSPAGGKPSVRKGIVAAESRSPSDHSVQGDEPPTPRSPHLKAHIRSPQQLYSLSESTHASGSPSASSSHAPVHWLPSDTLDGQAEPEPPSQGDAPRRSEIGRSEQPPPAPAPAPAHEPNPVLASTSTSAPVPARAPTVGPGNTADPSARNMYAHSSDSAPPWGGAAGGSIPNTSSLAFSPDTQNAQETLAPVHSNPFIAPSNNQSLLSVGASMHSRRIVEGQSAEILTLGDEDED